MHGNLGFGAPISIELNGPEHEVLRELADLVVAEISTIEGVHNPESGASDGVPQMENVIDEDKAAAYGLTKEQVTGQIQLQFTGQIASIYREAGHEMNVMMMYPEDERSSIQDLENLQIQTATGAKVPLEEIATLTEEQGAVTLLRQNQQPQMNVSSDVMDRDLGGVVNDIEATLEIGRASCRERVEVLVGAGALNKKRGRIHS